MPVTVVVAEESVLSRRSFSPGCQHGNEPKALVSPSSRQVFVVNEAEPKSTTHFPSGEFGADNGNGNGLGLGTDKVRELDLAANVDR